MNWILGMVLALAGGTPFLAAAESPAKNGPPRNTEAWVIAPRVCRTCQTQTVWSSFLKFFPDVQTHFLTEDDAQAKTLIKELKIKMLPAFVLSRNIELEKSFGQVKDMLIDAGDRYLLNPSSAGVSYFVDRKVQPGRLDLFIFWTQRETLPILKMVEGLIHQKQSRQEFALQFVGRKDPQSGELVSPLGRREVQESMIYACVENQYPKEAWKYLNCRLANIEDLFWQDCLPSKDVDKDKITSCARGEMGKKLFQEKSQLSEELGIGYAPLFLLDGVEVFGVTEQSTLKDILSVIGQ